jgi:glutamine synthetase
MAQALSTIEDVENALRNDTKVKVAGIDADGVLRGKVMAKDKFLSATKSGFGFCRHTSSPSAVNFIV